VGRGRSSVVGNCGKVLEGSLEAAVVEPAHSDAEEDRRTVADHPDQPGLKVDHALRTAWVVVGHSDLGPLVQAWNREHSDRTGQKQERMRLARRPDGTGIAG